MSSIKITENANSVNASTFANEAGQKVGLIDIFETGEVNFSFDGGKKYSTLSLVELKSLIAQAEQKFK
jgi:hypothetical protein